MTFWGGLMIDLDGVQGSGGAGWCAKKSFDGGCSGGAIGAVKGGASHRR